jgi:hypothetical protein
LRAFSNKQVDLCVNGASLKAVSDDQGHVRTMSLHVGSTLLWNVPDRADGGYRLRFDGSIPVRVAAFDVNHGWICCREVAGSGAEDFEVPAGTTRLSLTGLAPLDAEQSQNRVFGWHRRSSLIQVNPYANLGEGVIVSTRAPRRNRQGVLSLDHGLTYADQTVAANQVQLEDSSSRPGWIETVVPASVQTVTVLLKRADDQPVDESQLASAIEVSIPTDATELTGARKILEAQQVMIEGARVNISYSIPDDERRLVNELLSVLVRTAPGWTQQGVVATEDGLVSAGARRQGTTLESRAAPMIEAAEMKTNVDFVY